MNQQLYGQAVIGAVQAITSSTATLANVMGNNNYANYVRNSKACVGVVRQLTNSNVNAAIQWPVPQGTNWIGAREVDHLFEVQYCGKLFAICIYQMQSLHNGFEPLLSDVLFVADICAHPSNLYAIRSDFHHMKTGYLEQGSESALIPLAGNQPGPTARQTGLIDYLDTVVNPHGNVQSFQATVQAARNTLPGLANIATHQQAFRAMFCDALLHTPFTQGGWAGVFNTVRHVNAGIATTIYSE